MRLLRIADVLRHARVDFFPRHEAQFRLIAEPQRDRGQRLANHDRVRERGMPLAAMTEPRHRLARVEVAGLLKRALAVAIQLVDQRAIVSVEVLALLLGAGQIAVGLAIEGIEPLLKARLVAADEGVNPRRGKVAVPLEKAEDFDVARGELDNLYAVAVPTAAAVKRIGLDVHT